MCVYVCVIIQREPFVLRCLLSDGSMMQKEFPDMLVTIVLQPTDLSVQYWIKVNYMDGSAGLLHMEQGKDMLIAKLHTLASHFSPQHLTLHPMKTTNYRHLL